MYKENITFPKLVAILMVLVLFMGSLYLAVVGIQTITDLSTKPTTEGSVYVSDDDVYADKYEPIAFGSDLVFASATSAEEIKRDIQATVLPVNATNKSVKWSLAWADPTSIWATDKAISSYMTIVPYANDSKLAQLTCKAPFGEPAVLTVTSLSDLSVSATCRLDYSKKADSYDFIRNGEIIYSITNGMGASSIEADTDLRNVELIPAYYSETVGTLESTITEVELKWNTKLDMRGSLGSYTTAVDSSVNFNQNKINGEDFMPIGFDNIYENASMTFLMASGAYSNQTGASLAFFNNVAYPINFVSEFRRWKTSNGRDAWVKMYLQYSFKDNGVLISGNQEIRINAVDTPATSIDIDGGNIII